MRAGAGKPARPLSATTAASRAFVDTHIVAARELGRRLADEIDDPGRFAVTIRTGLETLADPACLAGQRIVAPGIGPSLGIRLPLLEATYRSLTRELRGVRAARLLPAAEALAQDSIRELRWFACWLLGRILPDEPEQAWQVLRGLASEAGDWISVDTLAATLGPGILAEPYRWAELDQLVYSRNRWERRLVGSTIATIPFADRAAGRAPAVVERGLVLVGLLIGDSEPDVQKALGWALRNLAAIDRAAVTAFCREEAVRAAATSDGARAWVVRDALNKLDPADAAEIRGRLVGVRRTPRPANTSAAAATAAAFGTGLGDAAAPRAPLT